MSHNPSETHCPKCDVQLVFTVFEGEAIGSCPNCNFCEAVDPEEYEEEHPLPQDTYDRGESQEC
jgi:uncharacterized Zn finger protein (UPF0148 family)